MSTPAETLSPSAETAISQAIDAAGVTKNRDLIRRILVTGIDLGVDRAERPNIKITAAAIDEMRRAFLLYAPYAGIPKVTIFGSARTKPEDPLYRQAHDVAAQLAQAGWMVVTGAGPGIMQAAAEGAGPDMALGISIRLPFEDKPSAAFEDQENKLIAMKYFFTRKLMLIKESSGFVCIPGGFGTMDEMFELLTLQQTGKTEPTPIVLLDEEGGTFWKGLERFVNEQMVTSGVISPDDLDRVLITDSVEAAEAAITGFWRNYDSLRWVGDLLVLRVRTTPTDADLASLNDQFGALLTSGTITATAPLDAEVVDGDTLDLPRIVMHLNPFKVGELYRVITAINQLPSAPEDIHAGTNNPEPA